MTLSGSRVCSLLLIPILSLFSCQKKDVAGPAGPQGPTGPPGENVSAKGDIQGKVILYDIFGQPLTDNSGATVSLDNTSPLQQAVTTADGSFTISSVHAGTYDLTIQKQGYGTMPYFNFAHAGTPSPSQTGIIALEQQMPSQYDIKQLKIDSMTFRGGNFLIFTAILAHPQKVTNPVLMYFNDVTGVGNNKNKLVYRTFFSQSDDTTLVYSALDYYGSQIGPMMAGYDYFYMSVAIDNAKGLTYRDKQGNQVYPAAGKPSPEVRVHNILQRY